MSSTVELPIWLFVLIGAFALLSIINYLFLPGLRRVLRYFVNRVITDVNTRLRLKIPTFQLTKREVLIDRLVYDPEVMKAVAVAAKERDTTRDVIMAEVILYAREMVPAFNPLFYFRIGHRFTRWAVNTFYNVRIGHVDERSLTADIENSAYVFVMNHRSNLDYLVVTYLSTGRAAISFGAGEWARTWPFSAILRMAGAYILRRNMGDPLYHKVLERYVQQATGSMVPQAIFSEGHLSRDGMIHAPKLGMLGYITKVMNDVEGIGILFIPVGLNYDAVLEERMLVANADKDFRGVGRGFVYQATIGYLWPQAKKWLSGHRQGMGTACASFGAPVSFGKWLSERGTDFKTLEKQEFFETVAALGNELTSKLIRIVPVVFVPAIAAVLTEAGEPLARDELKRRTLKLAGELRDHGAHMAYERDEEPAAFDKALDLLQSRNLVIGLEEDRIEPAGDDIALVEYHAGSVRQLRAHLVEGKTDVE